MWFSSSLRNRKGSGPGVRGQAHKHTRKRSNFRPRIEALEDRWLPSTLTVMNNHDHGAGSLRAEIAAAASGDTIVFDQSLVGQTITLTSGELVINKNLGIEGLGANNLTVSGNNASRVFDVTNNATVTIADLTIANGSAMSATDPSQQGGGGVLNEPGATVYITNDVFSNNRASVVSGALENAGGPGVPATAIISGTTFIGNQAIGSVNGTTNPFMVFDGFGPGSGVAEGGAIDDDGNLTLTSCNFINNQALGVAGTDGISASAQGGALTVDGVATVSGCTFTDNRALAGSVPGSFGRSQGLGGAIDNFSALTVSSCVFADNQAVGGSGATSLPNPRAFAGVGGGIQSNSGTITISGSSFSDNQAIGGAGGVGGPGSVGFGGGLEARSSVLTLSDSTFDHNAAIGGAGGKGAMGGNAVGGGVAVDRGSTAIITNITVSHNQALGGAGGKGANGGNAWAGGLAVGGFSTFGISDSSSVSLSGSTLSDNLAIGGDGGARGNGGDGEGGGVFVGTGAALTVTGSTITQNHANGGSGSGGGSAGQGEGGGVYNDGTFTFDAATVINQNHASTSNDNIFP